jgi:hypothetical protein
VGRRAGLDTEARGKILSPLPGIELRPPGRPVRSQTLYRLSYNRVAEKINRECNKYIPMIQPPSMALASTLKGRTPICKQVVTEKRLRFVFRWNKSTLRVRKREEGLR